MRILTLLNNTAIGIAVTVVGFSLTSSVHAQCSSGNCGNVGVADGYGGYSSVGYGFAGYGHTVPPPSGGQWGNRHVQPLFDNYFTQGYANRAEAALYISPVGVPGWVGHTYNTYQPFYPHHYLYKHHDSYHSYYDQGFGLNRTKASYSSPPLRTAIHGAVRHFEIPR